MKEGLKIESVCLTEPGEPWPEAQPLPPDLPPVEPFDTDALPAALRPFVEDVTARLGCAVEFPAIAAMVAAGACIGRGLAIRPKMKDSWHEFGNLWGVAIGSPASMKSPALSEILRPLKGLLDGERKAWKVKHAAWKKEFERWEIRYKAITREAQREAAKAYKEGREPELRPLPEAPPEPICPRLRINDTTTEKLVEIAKGNPRGLLLDKDELAGWFASFSKSGRESDRSFYLETTSGKEDPTVDRIGRGSIHAPPIALSIIGGIQPGPIRRLVDDAAARVGDDGLLQRFGLLVWPDLPGRFAFTDALPDRRARNLFADKLGNLRRLNSESVTVGAVDDFAPEAPFLRFTLEAAECFGGWYEETVNRLRADSTAGPFQAHLMKLAGKTVPALALICECCDSTRPEAVGMAALTRALRWADILESHARRLYAPALSPEIDAARRLGGKIAAGDLGDEFTQREIYRKGWEKLTCPDDVSAACETLGGLGWLRPLKKPGSPPGRPADRWQVNPGAFRNPPPR